MIKGMVTCIVPTYKRSDSLLKAISSILNQTYQNIELIVVDDNNPNDEYSLNVQNKLSKIKDSRLRYIQQEKHINGAVARNVGIRSSKGEYIAFLDDDDEWLPGKLDKQINLLTSMKDYGGVACYYVFYKNDKPEKKSLAYNNENLHKKVLGRSVSIFTSTVLLKKDFLLKAGLFDETLKRHQDLQLLLDFLDKFKIAVLDQYLVKINIDSVINKPNSVDFISIKENFFLKAKKHFNKYKKRERKQMYYAHYFEIIFVALKEKNYRIVLKYLLKIGINLQAYFNLLIKIINRRKQKV